MKLKTTKHADQRLYERFGVENGDKIKRRISCHDAQYIKTHGDMEISLVKLNQTEAAITVWSPKERTLVSVLTPDQYLQRSEYQMESSSLQNEIEKYCKVQRDGVGLRSSIGELSKFRL